MPNTARKSIPVFRSTEGHFYTPGVLESLERAASRLGVAPDDLRNHCERLAEHCGDISVAHLYDGTVAFKNGDAWKFRFPVVGGVTSGERGNQ